MTKAEIIDDFAIELDAYPWIPYEPVGQIIVDECLAQGEGHLFVSTGAALLQKESGFKNLFGCDHGLTPNNGRAAPFCQCKVTRGRVNRLLESGLRNGIGTSQLTATELVMQAESEGGVEFPRYQIRVGFRTLLGHILALDDFQAGAAAYNAGRGNWRSVYDTYGADMVRLQHEWYLRFKGEIT
jgi:hypothetical protein